MKTPAAESGAKDKNQPKSAVTTEFWLLDGTGKEHCFTLNANLPLEQGHSVSLIKAQGRKGAMFVALSNHTIRKTVYTCSPTYALSWLGLGDSGLSTTLGYVSCALLCVPFWFFVDGNLVALMGLTLVCAIGVQFALGSKVKSRFRKNLDEFHKHVVTYAEQVHVAIETLGSEPEAVLETVAAEED